MCLVTTWSFLYLSSGYKYRLQVNNHIQSTQYVRWWLLVSQYLSCSEHASNYICVLCYYLSLMVSFNDLRHHVGLFVRLFVRLLLCGYLKTCCWSSVSLGRDCSFYWFGCECFVTQEWWGGTREKLFTGSLCSLLMLALSSGFPTVRVKPLAPSWQCMCLFSNLLCPRRQQLLHEFSWREYAFLKISLVPM